MARLSHFAELKNARCWGAGGGSEVPRFRGILHNVTSIPFGPVGHGAFVWFLWFLPTICALFRLRRSGHSGEDVLD